MDIGLWPTAFPTARAHVFMPAVSFSLRANSPYVVVSPYGMDVSSFHTAMRNAVPSGFNGIVSELGDFPSKY